MKQNLFFIIFAFSATVPLASAQEKVDTEQKSQGIFQSREEYHAFFGGLKAPKNPEINEMLPAIHQVVMSSHGLSKSQGYQIPFNKSKNGMMGLLANKKIREEIEMVDEQYEKLNEMGRELQNQMTQEIRSIFIAKDRSVDLKDPEKIIGKIREIRNSSEERFNSILLPHQMERLRQVSLQTQMRRKSMVAVLAGEPLASELKIDDEQKQQLKKAEQEIQEELAREIQKLQAEARDKLIGKLKKDQQIKLRDLIGDDVEFRLGK